MDLHVVYADNEEHVVFKNARFVGYKQEYDDNVVVAEQELKYHADV